jgi:hypothetical protein
MFFFAKDLTIKRVVSWECDADGSHSERPSKAAWGRNPGDSTHQRISLGTHQGEVGQESVHWGDHLRPHCQLGGSPCSMTASCICLQMLAVFPDDAVLLAELLTDDDGSDDHIDISILVHNKHNNVMAC